MARISVLLLSAMVGLSSCPALAQVYNCSGTWTSNPCENPSLVIDQPTDPNSSKPADLESQKQQRDKLSLVYHLKSFARKFDDYKQDVPSEVKVAEDFCLVKNTSLEDCRTKLNDVEQSLEQRENEKARVKIEQQRLELEKSQNGQTAVQINYNDDHDYNRYDPGIYNCHGIWQTKPCLHPDPKPIIPTPEASSDNKGNSIRLRQHKPTRKNY